MSRKAWSRIPKAKLRMEGSGFFFWGYKPSLSRNVAFIFLYLTLLYTCISSFQRHLPCF